MCTCAMLCPCLSHCCNMADQSSRKRSPIWDYSVVAEDTKYAVCCNCDKSVFRGGNSMKVYTTSNLVNHLKSQHKEIHHKYEEKHQKYLEEEQAKKPCSCKNCLNWMIKCIHGILVMLELSRFINLLLR